MKLIIGLGNISEEHQNTRHNFGFMTLDAMNNDWQTSKKAQCLYAKKKFGVNDTELIKPTTFMNNSGASIAYIVKKHDLKASDCLVVYDDLDLPLGTIRIGTFQSSGGHNGIKSITSSLGNDASFFRIRLGIGNETSEKIPAEKFVLQPFTKFEIKTVELVVAKAVEIINEIAGKPSWPKNQQTISVI